MARVYSAELRQRVIQASQEGLSARAAATRFDIGVTTAGDLDSSLSGVR